MNTVARLALLTRWDENISKLRPIGPITARQFFIYFPNFAILFIYLFVKDKLNLFSAGGFVSTRRWTELSVYIDLRRPASELLWRLCRSAKWFEVVKSKKERTDLLR